MTRPIRRAAVLLVALVAAVLLGPATASAHGYTENPPSRGRLS